MVSRSVDPERYVESVRAYFLCLPEGSAFPSDEAFRAGLVSRNMYRFRHRDAPFERLENNGRKERVPLSPYTVDHIMPQGERLPDAWRAELGPDWAQTWQSLRHTLGNLTLTAFNPEMGNGSFRDKRDAEKGYRDGPLRLVGARPPDDDYRRRHVRVPRHALRLLFGRDRRRALRQEQRWQGVPGQLRGRARQARPRPEGRGRQYQLLHVRAGGREWRSGDRAGHIEAVDLHAEMDVLVVLSNCPEALNEAADRNPTPIRAIVYSP